MKILHVIPGLEHTCGGPGVVALSICKELTDLGVECDVVSTRDPFNRYELVNEHLIINNVKLFERWKQQHFAFSTSLGRWLYQNIHKYDVVHIHTIFNYPSSSAAAYAKKLKVPYIITPHGMLEPWALSNKSWKKHLAYNLFIKKQLQNARAIHIIAVPEGDNIKSLGIKTQLAFVTNGIEKKEFNILPNSQLFYQNFPTTRNKTLILFLGRIDPKKGLDLLASAFAQVHKQFPQTHLVIAGEATFDNLKFLQTAQNFFVEVGCSHAVTFTGRLSGPIKYSALAVADIYVSPSYSEGFSISVLEGMASGLPCVITTGCNFPEASANQAAHVVGIDAEEIANALIQCLKHPEEAKQMGDRARKFIFDNYTWDKIAEKFIDIYTQLQIN